MLRALFLLPFLAIFALFHTTSAIPSFREFTTALSNRPHTTSAGPLQTVRDCFARLFGPYKDRLEEETRRLSSPSKQPSPPGSTCHDEVVLRFNVTSEEEAASLAEASDVLFLDVWEYSQHWVDIRITQDVIPSLLGLLPDSLQRAHSPILDSRALARAIAQSYPSHVPLESSSRSSRQRGTNILAAEHAQDPSRNAFFEEYRPLSVLEPWMRLLESMNPSLVSVINLGKSYEGRDILGLRVGIGASQILPGPPRKTVLVQGGAHAREWISTSTVSYIAHSLIRSFGRDSVVTKLVQDFDFVFVPTINPDGYAYTWDTDRLWRKNRQPTSLRFCKGIDLDRAWDSMWDGHNSGNPCSGSYAGRTPFEGLEAKQVAEWAKNQTENNGVQFVGFLDLHSYSQQILYPYSFSCVEEPPTLEDLEELGEGLAKAFRLVHYHYYNVIPACEGNVMTRTGDGEKVLLTRMEGNGGSALDFFYRNMGVRRSFQIKLRDTGSYGFLLPKEYIVPTGEETFEALKYLGKNLQGDQVWNPFDPGYLQDDGPAQQPLT